MIGIRPHHSGKYQPYDSAYQVICPNKATLAWCGQQKEEKLEITVFWCN